MFRPRSLVVATFALALSATSLYAGDLRIPLPKKSKYTPVQKLNRDGVTAVQHHDYAKAKKLFYQAYLIDPNDPFTLNNLGYLAELEGDSDRAQRFYQLSSEQNSDAVVDKATNELVEGKPVSAVAGNAEDKGIKINRLNSEAIALLNKGRAPEADLVLQKALTVDARNPFTLNNIGYAKELEGELEGAYQYYTAAAATNSRERVEVTANGSWRGKEISRVAADNARGIRKRLRDDDGMEARVARLNLRAVSAINRNDRRSAREFIQQAYKLMPTDAFTLNNMGYLAELDGDRETADYYYDRAREANGAKARVTLATRKEAVGQRIGEVAENTDNLVLSKMDQDRLARQQQGGPVILRDRDNKPVAEPDKPVERPQVRVSDANGNLTIPIPASPSVSNPPAPTNNQGGQNGDGLLQPLPDTAQPTTVHSNDEEENSLRMPTPGSLPNSAPPVQNTQPPLPNNTRPQYQNNQPRYQNNAQPQTAPPAPKQGQNDGGLLMPLPDNQQPSAQPQNPPSYPQQQPQTTTQPQAAPAPKQGQSDGGLLLPLPDNQQPGAGQSPNSRPQSQTPPPQTQSSPQANSNTGVYTPPPAGTMTIRTTAKPKQINDNDPRAPKTNTNSQQNPSNVKKISDQ